MPSFTSFNHKVSRTVGAIDEIAFRTNLLALNAALVGQAVSLQRTVSPLPTPTRVTCPADQVDPSPGLRALEKSLRG